MTNPDLAAAGYVQNEPTWKSKPLPSPGAYLKATWLDSTEGRVRTVSTYGTLRDEATLSEDGARLTLPLRYGDLANRDVTLSDECLIDDWYQVSAPATAALPAPSFDLLEQPAPLAPEAATTTPDGSTVPRADAPDLPGMLRRWLYVDNEIKRVSALLDALKEEKSQLDSSIADECLDQGLTKPPGVDDMTFSFAPVYYVKYLEDEDGNKYTSEDVITALRASGLDKGLVKEGYNGNSLKSVLREMTEDGQQLPDELAKVVMVDSYSRVTATRSAARNRRGRPAAATTES